MKKTILAVMISAGVVLSAITPEEIIKKIDYNQAPDSVVYTAKMTMNKNGKTNEKQLKIFGKGKNRTFVEFFSPPRDKGTKYLRLEDNLWIYLPSVEKTQKISGHMLRDGMMGSDFSYEDQTERTKLFDNYAFALDNDEVIDGRNMYVMTLTAKPGVEVTYVKRRIWVDKEQFAVYKSEMYAKSGKLIKLLTAGNVKKIGDRYFTTISRMEDKIKTNSFTEIEMSEILLDQKISDDIFTMNNLEKKN